MPARRIAQNVVSCSATISACEKGQRWMEALALMCGMRDGNSRSAQPEDGRALEPDVITHNAVISACAKGEHWRKALKVFQDMRLWGVRPSTVTCNAALSACERGHAWQSALGLLQQMWRRGPKPDVISFSAAISACEHGQQWSKAVGLFRHMATRRVKPNAIACSAAISTCGEARWWAEALSLLSSMEDWRQGETTGPDESCPAARASSWEMCERTVRVLLAAGHLPEGMALFREAVERGLVDVRHEWESGVLDLHDLSLEAAEAAVCDELLRRSHAGNVRRDLVVVTGRGSHSPRGHSVVQTTVLGMLREEAGLDAMVDSRVAGRVRVKAGSLWRFALGLHPAAEGDSPEDGVCSTTTLEPEAAQGA
mmetsp:Transcript_22893/g.72018  ORF Transcript_22893/g.72018 Transcript_22893/m.72018 type:complete len:369 (-) Transcript_22893:77-1183(-)